MIKTKIERVGLIDWKPQNLLPSKKMAMRVGVSSFPTSSYFTRKADATSSTLPLGLRHGQCMQQMVGKAVTSRRIIACSAVQESSTSTVAAETKEEVKTAPEKSPEKPKRPAKAPAKALPQMMEEDVIPSLKSILEDQDDLSDIELSFQDNRLEGSLQKKGIPYSFWAFFPNGVLTGPKGFSLSSYGSGSSTVEPFLIDEKKITSRHVVFWVVKRLAAQGIIPVWKE